MNTIVTLSRQWKCFTGRNFSILLSRWSAANSGVPYKKYEASAEAGSSVCSSADVVVVGGGVTGCATLYHLAQLGCTNAVLVEKDGLTAGTTWHTAGLVWTLPVYPRDEEVEIIRRSQHLMKTLESVTGVNTGWINNGGILIATTEDRMNVYRRMHSLGNIYGVETHLLGPEETKKIYPLMNVDDIYGTLYSPSDGTIDPAGYCTALARAAKMNGAQVYENCSVTGIDVTTNDFGTKEVSCVHTNRGPIKTKAVVNCAGAWAPYLGDMAGVATPLIPLKHSYVVTERIEGIQNMPNCRDYDAQVYLKLQGDALCVGGYEQNPLFIHKMEKNFAYSLYELDWDVFTENIQGAMNRIPAIETSGVKSTVCGPESFTPDHKSLFGESPEVRGFYYGCGLNSAGMMYSGITSELAKWILQGKPDLELFDKDIRRFDQKLARNMRWVNERTHETYAKTMAIVWPHDEHLAGRNMKTDVLHQELLDAGCVYQERQGWERPGWFSDDKHAPVQQYDYYGQYGHQAHKDYQYRDLLRQDYTFGFPENHAQIGKEAMTCRQSAALFNMSYFGKYYLTGPDAQKAADWIFSNDVSKPAGSTVYTCMLNDKGLVESDLTVSVVAPGDGAPHAPRLEGNSFYVAAGGAVGPYVWAHINSVIQDNQFNCKLVDESDNMAMLSLQGPRSRDILQALTDTNLSNQAFQFSTHKVMDVCGHSVRALRLSFVGELGWELHIPNISALPIYRAIMEEGKKYDICNGGYRAIDSLSIEKGYRHWHADLRSDDTPLEAGLAFTCKLKSEVPFLGRDALVKQKSEGLKKRIACFTIDEHLPLHGLEGIWRNGQPVGFIRRADYAFSLNKTIAYGYVTNPNGGNVSRDFLKDGTYEIERFAQRLKAKIHLKSPFDPNHNRIQGNYDV